MNILSLAEWDWAGVGYQLSEAINKNTKHTSVAVRQRKESVMNFPHQIISPSKKKLLELIAWCDVIHIHDDYTNLGKINKPTVITYHGSKYRKSNTKHNRIAMQNGWLQTVATLDLLRLGDNRWLPDARVMPGINVEKHKRFTVCQAPTSEIKSKEVVVEACKIADVELDLIENTDWKKCLERKAKCHLLVDQFKLGYGCNAIEAWLLGLPVIANANQYEHVLKMIEEKNDGELPFVFSEENAKKLAGVIVKLRDNNDYYSKFCDVGHRYAVKYHSPDSVSKIALGFYNDAIAIFNDKSIRERKKSYTTTNRRGKHQSIAYNPYTQTLIQHLYANHSQEEIMTPSGNKYFFDINNDIQPVDDCDVEFFANIFKKTKTRKKRNVVKEPVFRIVRNK